MMEPINYLVRVNCMTYNHAPFIVDAMNGFAMQQTTFPFVCVLVDDASTDGEPEVITNYMRENFDLADKTITIEEETDDYRLMFARHKLNQNCYFVALLLKYNHYSINKPKHPYFKRWLGTKYIALCEGDDYWIDIRKLQKQVDILENDLKIGLIYTEIDRYIQQENIFERDFFKSRPINNTHDDFLMNSWFLAPCTWLYRSELLRFVPALNSKMCFNGDTLSLLTYSKNSQVHFLNEVTAVYRVLQTSASHFDNYQKQRLFWRKNVNTRMFFLQDKDFYYRLKFWCKVFKEGRPSLRTHKDILLEWLCDGFSDFFRVLFINKTIHALISK